MWKLCNNKMQKIHKHKDPLIAAKPNFYLKEMLKDEFPKKLSLYIDTVNIIAIVFILILYKHNKYF